MKRRSNRSRCPVNYAVESFGDAWSLIIIRDIVFWGKRTFKEFASSKEAIATNILAARLNHLVAEKILRKAHDPRDRRVAVYTLTEKGLDLIPMLLEMSGWSTRHDPRTSSPKDFVERIYADREGMFALIRQTVQGGGSLFAGENSVAARLAKARRQP